MRAWQIVLGLVAVLGLVSTAPADFVLIGTEHREVRNSRHELGVLFDSSTANVEYLGYIETAYVNDDARLQIRSHRYSWKRGVKTVYAYDTSTVNVSGGYVSALRTYNSSSVNVSSGDVLYLNVRDNGSASIAGGDIYDLRVYDNGSVNVSGGEISLLRARGSSTVNVSGGEISTLWAYETSTVDLFGGDVYALWAYDTSTITVHVPASWHDWRTTGGLRRVGDEVLGTGVLAYRSAEDTWSLLVISQNDVGATIRIVPEPATLAMLALGAGLLAFRGPVAGGRHRTRAFAVIVGKDDVHRERPAPPVRTQREGHER